MRPDGVDAVLDTVMLGQAIIGAVVDAGTFVTTRSTHPRSSGTSGST
ncbi:hypothetical protein [Actinoplanes sp. ATCC 53533]|nr:hypothetical protein [Actinoplanes sp. ATCC 53533]